MNYPSKQPMTNEELFDSENYILQCDYEDDEWLIFTTTEADNKYAEGSNIHIGFSEENYKYLLDTLLSADFMECVGSHAFDGHYRGNLYLSFPAHDQIPQHKEKIEFIALADVDMDDKLTGGKEVIEKLHTLLKSLYDKEFPERSPEEKAPVYDNQFQYQISANISMLNNTKQYLERICEKYGDDWGYMKKQSYETMVATIDGIIQDERSKMNGEK